MNVGRLPGEGPKFKSEVEEETDGVLFHTLDYHARENVPLQLSVFLSQDFSLLKRNHA